MVKRFGSSQLSVTGNKGPIFENFIIHKMSNNISDLVKRFNRNTTLHSKELKLENKKHHVSFRKVISRFIKSFIKRKVINTVN